MLPSRTASTPSSRPAATASTSEPAYFLTELVGRTTIWRILPSRVINASAAPKPRYSSSAPDPSDLKGSTAIDFAPPLFAPLGRGGSSLQPDTSRTAATNWQPLP